MDFLTRAFLTKTLLRAFRAVLLLAVFALSIVSTFLPFPRFDLSLLSITQTSTGPTVYIGLLGSCTRYDPSALAICTGPTIPPQLDTSVLSALSTKTQAHVQAHLAIKYGAPNFSTAVAFSICHILVLISTPLMVELFEVPSSRRWPWIHPIALLGIPGVGVPLLVTIHLQLMFDVAIKIFNASQGQFVLRTGKLWILMTVCYVLLAAAFVTTVAFRFWPTEDPNDRDAERPPPEDSEAWMNFRVPPFLPLPPIPPISTLDLNSSVDRQVPNPSSPETITTNQPNDEERPPSERPRTPSRTPSERQTPPTSLFPRRMVRWEGDSSDPADTESTSASSGTPSRTRTLSRTPPRTPRTGSFISSDLNINFSLTSPPSPPSPPPPPPTPECMSHGLPRRMFPSNSPGTTWYRPDTQELYADLALPATAAPQSCPPGSS